MIARALRIGLALAALAAAPARAASPFEPAPAPKAKIVRLLAPEGAVDPKTLEAFEQATGWAVAYDAYDEPAHIVAKWREGPYDVISLPGPALASAVAARALRRIARSQIANARSIAPAVAAKLAVYDPGGAYGLAWGWSAAGIVYDAARTDGRLGGAPASWSFALSPDLVRKLVDCGVVLPNARDALFVAAWRLMGVDPSRPREIDVKAAADLLLRARSAARAFAAPDPVGAMASGSACLTVGDAAAAEFARKRSLEGGAGRDIRFVAAKEGGPMTIEAFAIPADASQAGEAAALIDFLLGAETLERNARVAGLISAEAPPPDALKTLWPEGALEPRLAALVEKEWSRVVAPPPAPAKPEAKSDGKDKAKTTAKPVARRNETAVKPRKRKKRP